MVTHLLDILVDDRAFQIHRCSHCRSDGRCSKDYGERSDPSLFEDIHVQPSIVDGQNKRLKYRFVPTHLRALRLSTPSFGGDDAQKEREQAPPQEPAP